MSPNRFSIAIVVLLIGFAANAGAQRNELSAIVGRTFISDQGVKGVPSFDTNLRFGKGTSFEVNLARQLRGGEGIAALTVEIPIVYNPDEDIHYSVNVVPKQYSSIFITPSLRANLLPEAPFSPWLSLGGGYGHFSEDSNLAGAWTCESGVGWACEPRYAIFIPVCHTLTLIPAGADSTIIWSVAE